jgi:hypothetical protein
MRGVDFANVALAVAVSVLEDIMIAPKLVTNKQTNITVDHTVLSDSTGGLLCERATLLVAGLLLALT